MFEQNDAHHPQNWHAGDLEKWIDENKYDVHLDYDEENHRRRIMKFDNGIELISWFDTPTVGQTFLIGNILPFLKEDLLNLGFIIGQSGLIYKMCSGLEEVKKDIQDLMNANFQTSFYFHPFGQK